MAHQKLKGTIKTIKKAEGYGSAPVLQAENAGVNGYALFECVAFFIDDWFDPKEQATRVEVYVWARDVGEAVDVSGDNWMKFCRLSNLLNWWAQPVQPASKR
ncbi:MAG: hypothetical protein ABMA15_04300 [Vicinamibacterales bacterium]